MDKFSLLCEPKYKVGLLGTTYFIGVIVTLAFVPVIGDRCGRKWVFVSALLVSAAAQLWLMITTDLTEAYICQFLIGATFAGRIIVGLSYVLEFT